MGTAVMGPSMPVIGLKAINIAQCVPCQNLNHVFAGPPISDNERGVHESNLPNTMKTDFDTWRGSGVSLPSVALMAWVRAF